MLSPSQPVYLDVSTRAAWQTQVTMTKRTPGLLPLLVHQRHALVPRFARAYRQLRILPKRVRRQLQRHWRRSLAGVALLVALGPGTAWADIINVDGTTCTLVNAITTANTDTDTGGCVQLPTATAGADTIVLQPGSVHTLTAVNNMTYGPSGLPVLSSEITLEGNNSTITRDSGAPEFRLLAVNSGGQLVLQNTTLSGGLLAGPNPLNDGGGLANYGGQVTLEKCTVTGNSADAGGGVYDRGGTLSLIDGSVSSNTAATDGGGVEIFLSGTLSLTNSTVSGNSAGRFGGGLENYGYATLLLTDSTVTGNSAARTGGGVDNSFYTTLTVTKSTISGNIAGYGGGIENFGATMTVTDSTVSGNSAVLGGGMTNRRGDATATIINSTIASNSSESSGGGVLSGEGILILLNSTVSENSAHFNGGGVYTYDDSSSATLTLSNSTVSDNTAVHAGGGVYNRNASLILLRSLLSGNTAPSGAEVFHNTDAITANNFNLFGHAALTTAQALVGFTPGATDITATSDGTTPTALSAILDPTLADNGGPTETHTLVTGSPALDASPADNECPPTDQRGVPRPQGSACDIGAVELVPGVAIPAEVCGDRTPTMGCTVNGQDNQLCLSITDKSTIIGTPGPDVIVATGRNNTLKGGEGDDCIIGGPGKDRIEGQDGNDVIFGGGGNDQVRGGTGNDLIVTGSGNDQVQGDEGTDLLLDSGGTNTLKGKGGDDVIVAPGTAGVIDGGSGHDECIGGTEQRSCP